MNRLENETILKQLNWRYACKKFDPTKKIPDADFEVLVESLRLSASSYGLQPWKFIVVNNPDVRKQLHPLSWGQSPVIEASHFIVLAYKEKLDEAHIDKHVLQTSLAQGTEIANLAKFKQVMMRDLLGGPRFQTIEAWAQRQTYIALGSILTTAAIMHVDALPMEGLDPAGYDRVLQLEGTGYKTSAAVALGYRSDEDKYQRIKKVRFNKEDVISYI